MKRAFDLFFSFFGILIFSPFAIIIAIAIVSESKGGVFYRQIRVGKNNKDFRLIKFRTMKTHADKGSLITIGKDSRITKVGSFLRKYKLDEFPQLFNILEGTMSFVGPRPEVRKYVDLYSEEQKRILNAKPGLTDYASIEFINESEILGKASNPEHTYIHEIMPAKLKLNEKYLNNISLAHDFKIIFKTIRHILFQ